jgi:hypothetical protein
MKCRDPHYLEKIVRDYSNKYECVICRKTGASVLAKKEEEEDSGTADAYWVHVFCAAEKGMIFTKSQGQNRTVNYDGSWPVPENAVRHTTAGAQAPILLASSHAATRQTPASYERGVKAGGHIQKKEENGDVKQPQHFRTVERAAESAREDQVPEQSNGCSARHDVNHKNGAGDLQELPESAGKRYNKDVATDSHDGVSALSSDRHDTIHCKQEDGLDGDGHMFEATLAWEDVTYPEHEEDADVKQGEHDLMDQQCEGSDGRDGLRSSLCARAQDTDDMTAQHAHTHMEHASWSKHASSYPHVQCDSQPTAGQIHARENAQMAQVKRRREHAADTPVTCPENGKFLSPGQKASPTARVVFDTGKFQIINTNVIKEKQGWLYHVVTEEEEKLQLEELCEKVTEVRNGHVLTAPVEWVVMLNNTRGKNDWANLVPTSRLRAGTTLKYLLRYDNSASRLTLAEISRGIGFDSDRMVQFNRLYKTAAAACGTSVCVPNVIVPAEKNRKEPLGKRLKAGGILEEPQHADPNAFQDNAKSHQACESQQPANKKVRTDTRPSESKRWDTGSKDIVTPGIGQRSAHTRQAAASTGSQACGLAELPERVEEGCPRVNQSLDSLGLQSFKASLAKAGIDEELMLMGGEEKRDTNEVLRELGLVAGDIIKFRKKVRDLQTTEDRQLRKDERILPVPCVNQALHSLGLLTFKAALAEAGIDEELMLMDGKEEKNDTNEVLRELGLVAGDIIKFRKKVRDLQTAEDRQTRQDDATWPSAVAAHADGKEQGSEGNAKRAQVGRSPAPRSKLSRQASALHSGQGDGQSSTSQGKACVEMPHQMPAKDAATKDQAAAMSSAKMMVNSEIPSKAMRVCPGGVIQGAKATDKAQAKQEGSPSGRDAFTEIDAMERDASPTESAARGSAHDTYDSCCRQSPALGMRRREIHRPSLSDLCTAQSVPIYQQISTVNVGDEHGIFIELPDLYYQVYIRGGYKVCCSERLWADVAAELVVDKEEHDAQGASALVHKDLRDEASARDRAVAATSSNSIGGKGAPRKKKTTKEPREEATIDEYQASDMIKLRRHICGQRLQEWYEQCFLQDGEEIEQRHVPYVDEDLDLSRSEAQGLDADMMHHVHVDASAAEVPAKPTSIDDGGTCADSQPVAGTGSSTVMNASSCVGANAVVPSARAHLGPSDGAGCSTSSTSTCAGASLVASGSGDSSCLNVAQHADAHSNKAQASKKKRRKSADVDASAGADGSGLNTAQQAEHVNESTAKASKKRRSASAFLHGSAGAAGAKSSEEREPPAQTTDSDNPRKCRASAGANTGGLPDLKIRKKPRPSHLDMSCTNGVYDLTQACDAADQRQSRTSPAHPLDSTACQEGVPASAGVSVRSGSTWNTPTSRGGFSARGENGPRPTDSNAAPSPSYAHGHVAPNNALSSAQHASKLSARSAFGTSPRDCKSRVSNSARGGQPSASAEQRSGVSPRLSPKETTPRGWRTSAHQPDGAATALQVSASAKGKAAGDRHGTDSDSRPLFKLTVDIPSTTQRQRSVSVSVVGAATSCPSTWIEPLSPCASSASPPASFDHSLPVATNRHAPTRAQTCGAPQQARGAWDKESDSAQRSSHRPSLTSRRDATTFQVNAVVASPRNGQSNGNVMSSCDHMMLALRSHESVSARSSLDEDKDAHSGEPVPKVSHSGRPKSANVCKQRKHMAHALGTLSPRQQDQVPRPVADAAKPTELRKLIRDECVSVALQQSSQFICKVRVHALTPPLHQARPFGANGQVPHGDVVDVLELLKDMQESLKRENQLIMSQELQESAEREAHLTSTQDTQVVHEHLKPSGLSQDATETPQRTRPCTTDQVCLNVLSLSPLKALGERQVGHVFF